MTPAGRIARDVGRTVFGIDPAGYHSARLGYPEELYPVILDRAGGDAVRAIVEVGAGTGIATAELLRPEVTRYVAVVAASAVTMAGKASARHR